VSGASRWRRLREGVEGGQPEKTIRALLYFALTTGISAVAMMLGASGPLKPTGRVMLAITILALIAAGVVYWMAAH